VKVFEKRLKNYCENHQGDFRGTPDARDGWKWAFEYISEWLVSKNYPCDDIVACDLEDILDRGLEE
jgi:hypothetical protein